MLCTVRAFFAFPELCGFKTRGGRWTGGCAPHLSLTCSPFSSPLIFAPCRPTVALAVTDYVDAPAGDEVELESKRLQLEQKRVFFNLKQNSRGKFLKVWCGVANAIFCSPPCRCHLWALFGLPQCTVEGNLSLMMMRFC